VLRRLTGYGNCFCKEDVALMVRGETKNWLYGEGVSPKLYEIKGFH
jgi:hypothetical protein